MSCYFIKQFFEPFVDDEGVLVVLLLYKNFCFTHLIVCDGFHLELQVLDPALGFERLHDEPNFFVEQMQAYTLELLVSERNLLHFIN